MPKLEKHIVADAAASLALPVLALVAWGLQAGPESLLPSPAAVAGTFAGVLADGSLATNLLISLPRLVSGFGIGALAGLGLGLAMGTSVRVERLLGPSFHALRQVPLVGWVPLVVLWFGIGEFSKALFVALGAFYPMVLNTFAGIRGVNAQHVELARCLCLPRRRLAWQVILPAALPQIRTGSLVALNMGWVFVVVAETLTETNGGLATFLSTGRETFRMDLILIGVLATGLLGFLLNLAARGFWHLVLSGRPDMAPRSEGSFRMSMRKDGRPKATTMEPEPLQPPRSEGSFRMSMRKDGRPKATTMEPEPLQPPRSEGSFRMSMRKDGRPKATTMEPEPLQPPRSEGALT